MNTIETTDSTTASKASDALRGAILPLLFALPALWALQRVGVPFWPSFALAFVLHAAVSALLFVPIPPSSRRLRALQTWLGIDRSDGPSNR